MVWLLIAGSLNAQNIYNQSNAASIENESNTTTGWTGTAVITSDNTTAQNGTYSLKITTAGSGREARYSFTAVTGSVYNISIWARRGAVSNNPAFANWLGVQGFSTTLITTQIWTQYNFTVTATNTTPQIRVYAGPIGAAAGMEVFVDAITITLQTPADTQAPTAPSNLAVSNITTNAATINWSASTDNVGVVNYSIRQNNITVGMVDGNTTVYQAVNLTPSTSYSYTVIANDAANNVSEPGGPLVFSTATPAPDTTPPGAPTGLSSSMVTANSVNLSWNPSSDNTAVTGYNIYMDNILNGSVQSTSYQATGLTGATTYSFYVVALDAAGNVSSSSDTIQVTTTDPAQVTQYTTSNANLPTVDWSAASLYASGNVGIGTTPSSAYKLAVNGNIRAKEIVVETGWSDFVFEPGYDLWSLDEVESYIKAFGHLPQIPSAKEVEENGIALAKMNQLLLMKIEEITLYLIQANKRIAELEELTGIPSTQEKGIVTSY